MKLSIVSSIRIATVTAVWVVLAGCSSLTLPAGKWREPDKQTISDLASGKPLEISEARGERRATVAGRWLADARDGLANTLHIAGGGAGGAVMGAIGGAGAGFLTVAKAGGCPDPATCNSLVAGMMTAGAVIGGVIGFVEGVRKARLELAAKTRPQPSRAKPTDPPIFPNEPSPNHR